MCERQRPFVKKVCCIRQNSNRPVLCDQDRKLMLVYWLGFAPLSDSDFAGVIGAEGHHPCTEILSMGLLSLCIAPLSPCAERDDLQLWICSENQCLRLLPVPACGVCPEHVCLRPGAASTAILIKLQLTLL